MAVRRVEPDEAAQLIEEGWTYLDVRSVAEFAEGHAPGAYNIPLLDFEPGQGLRPNPNFLLEVLAAFEPEQPLVVACKAGGRSARAAAMLAESGFSNLVDMRGGFYGEVSPDGTVACAGWAPRGLPVVSGDEPGRNHVDLRKLPV
ncbi:MAG TPA: rhodanese-like domain-containing protein [Candidatus Limnocylindrales bacterium]|nr:rhodanese-like domain-containing protein [Candidatus Limnocylindrales bacterium]